MTTHIDGDRGGPAIDDKFLARLGVYAVILHEKLTESLVAATAAAESLTKMAEVFGPAMEALEFLPIATSPELQRCTQGCMEGDDECLEACYEGFMERARAVMGATPGKEQAAAGREPSGDAQDLIAAKEMAARSEQRTIDREEREQVRSGWTDRRYRR